MVDRPGVYEISMEEYHLGICPVPELSRSVIKDLLFRSPAHAFHNHPKLNPNFIEDDGGGKFDVGSAAHDVLLQGIDNVEVIEADDWRKKDVRGKREAAREEGKIPLLGRQYESIKRMVYSAHVQIARCKELGVEVISDRGKSELSYVWTEDETWLKARPDWISDDRRLIIDYKTTETSANPDDYLRIIVSNGLDIQAALYSRGVKAIERTDPRFVFVVQETYEPFLCSFIALTPQFLEMGLNKVDHGINIWRECMKKGVWQGYPQRVAWVDPPAWALSSWDSTASNLGVGK